MSVFALHRGKYYLDCNSNVVNSQILNSDIDMGGGVITSHGSPINPTDVANKDYVDGYVLGSLPPIITISLTGTNFTLISVETEGIFKITIKNLVPNGPSAHFELSKSSSSEQPFISRTMSSAGSTTFEKLLVTWDPGNGVYLRKTGLNYDGNYRCRLDHF